VLDRCLQFFLNHLPDGLLVLVTSRQRPDWHLARLRLSRQLLELHEQDLRLTHDEALALLDRTAVHCAVRPWKPDPAQRRLGGRAAFLAAGGIEAGSEAHCPRRCTAGRADPRLPAEEVIDCLPAEVRHFSTTPRLRSAFAASCATPCAKPMTAPKSCVSAGASGVPGAAGRARPLVSLSPFVRSAAHGPRPSRGAGGEPAPARLPLVQCPGLLDEAVEQALRAGHLDVAANLVQNLSEEQLLAEQNVGMLLRWKMDLPDSLLISTPRLIVLYSWALGLACQLDAAEELASHLSRFLPAPSATAQKSMLAQWLALSGIIARGRGHRELTQRYCSEALESLPAKRYGQRLMCLSTCPIWRSADGDLWRAQGLNRESLELAQRVGNPLFEALAHYDRARVLQSRGEILRALDECIRAWNVAWTVRATSVCGACAADALRRFSVGDACNLSRPVRIAERSGEARACRDISVLIGHCVIARLDGSSGEFARPLPNSPKPSA
jgi:LuxR family maltose regulon positive regulatory protein